jgi:FkbM family methyltransferase
LPFAALRLSCRFSFSVFWAGFLSPFLGFWAPFISDLLLRLGRDCAASSCQSRQVDGCHRAGARFVNVGSLPAIVQNILRTRRAFRNWLTICVVVGIAAPSSIPPRQGSPWLGKRRQRFVTRGKTLLETEAGNGSPVIEVFAYGEYELALDWTRVHRVIDVGAHVGSFALWVCERAPGVRIISIEPEPRNFSDLESNIARNQLGTRIDAVNAALGAHSGTTTTLHVPMNRESGSTLATEGTVIDATEMTLAELLERLNGPLDLLKLDCEGAEWEVLASLDAKTWARISRLVMECHIPEGKRVSEMTDLLVSNGLNPSVLSQGPSGVTWCNEVAVIWAERSTADLKPSSDA